MVGDIGKRAQNKLSDRRIRAWIAQSKAGKADTKKLFDGGGLYLTLTPKTKRPAWRVKYWHNKREGVYAVGMYPEVTLAAAREELVRVKLLLKAGKDPVIARQLAREAVVQSQATLFRAVAEEWLTVTREKQEWSSKHFGTTRKALERDVYPSLGGVPIQEVSTLRVVALLDKIQSRVDRRNGRRVRETAARVRVNLARIFDYAKTKGLYVGDSPVPNPESVLSKPPRVRGHPALTTFAALGDLLRRAQSPSLRLSEPVRFAVRLGAFTAVRSANLTGARWEAFDLEAEQPVWRISRGEMKVKDRDEDFMIPLGPTIAAELRSWRARWGNPSEGWVLPNAGGEGPVTFDALTKCYRVTLGMKGKHVPHGWRSSLRTLAGEANWSKDTARLSLDHELEGNDVDRAYDRAQRWADRVALMQWWDARLVAAQADAR